MKKSITAILAATVIILSFLGVWACVYRENMGSMAELNYLQIIGLGTVVIAGKKKSFQSFFQYVDRGIYEPVRFLVLEKLWIHGTSSFTHLAGSIRAEIKSLTNGNLSSHLSYLERLGYVKAERFIEVKKAKSNYTITDKGKKAFDFFLISLYNRIDQSIRDLKIEEHMHAKTRI